jgi:endo-1,4-beta-xylanase
MMNNKKVSNPKAGYFMCLTYIMVFMVIYTMQSIAQPLSRGKGKFLGCGQGVPIPSGFDSYWNQITPGNEGKWGSVEGSQGSYNWTGLDQLYNYAIQRGLKYKHHTLIWGQQQPGWISALDSASQRAEIEEWIRLVGERYPLMDYIDVVNEALTGHNPPDGGGSPARANYLKALGGSGATGWDWVIKSFELARKYCAPGVKLILNDYGIINDNNATTQYLTIINLLKARNLIDGIGVQGHRFELMNKDTANLRYNLNRLAATGLPIYITELDLGVDNNATYDPNIQLSEYKRIFPVLWNHPGVKGITFWGYIEGQMWQVNTYLLYSNGSETPAYTWLRNFLTAGNYRSHQNGNWNDVKTWENYDGSQWISPAPNTPSIVNGAIAIQSGHTVTVSANDSADQVSVLAGGTLVINGGVNFQVKDGTDDDLDVSGTLTNNGTIAKDASATIKIFGTGKYEHTQDGGTIPVMDWGVGSTCELTNIVNTVPANISQSFYNFKWDCPNQSKDINLGWETGTTINGTLTIANTNWNRASTISPSNQLQLFAGSGSCTVSGIAISGKSALTSGYSVLTSGYSDTVKINGGITLSGGCLLLLSNNSDGTAIYNLKGNLTVSDSAFIGKTSAANASKIIFSNAGVQTLNLPATGVTLFGGPSIVVSNGSTLDAGTSVFGGTGSFRVESGAGLQTGHVNGINGNIQCNGTDGGGNNFSSEASYIYDGESAQVTGSDLPGTVADLTIDNSAGVTLTNSVTINGTLEMKSGALISGEKILSYGTESTLKYSGTSQTTTDVEFPSTGGPKNLVLNNNYGLTLHANRSINGNVDFLVGRLLLGSTTLTASSTSHSLSNKYVSTKDGGILRLRSVGATPTLFPVGTTSYAPVWITNTGIPDDIGVGVVTETAPAPYGGRLNARWDISETTPGGGNYSLQFGWTLSLENSLFRADRAGNAKIYLLPDTVEEGTGAYTSQFTKSPFSVSRSGIHTGGSFVVGKFKPGTGVEKNEHMAPMKMELSQNYPNPFNPTTQIHYSISQSGAIALKVYTILGQEVATLFEGIRQPGNYSVTFDGKGLSGGLYLYRMTAANFMETKKLLLLK